MTDSQTTFIICLFSAQIFGDFLLQPDCIIRNKKSLWVQALHALVLASLSYLICGDWKKWIIPLLVFLSHFVIDVSKNLVKKSLAIPSKKIPRSDPEDPDSPNGPGWLFITDQILHFGILLVFSLWVFPSTPPFFYWVALWGKEFLGILILLTGFVFTVFVNSNIIEFFMQSFQHKKGKNKGFHNGGRVIGLLERSIIFLLLLFNEPAGIGFLITAKTLFRFGEIQKSKNRKEVEYILIGTLLSFSLAIGVAGITILLSAKFGNIEYKLLKI